MLSLPKHTLSLHNIHPSTCPFPLLREADLLPHRCNISWSKSLNLIWQNEGSLTLPLVSFSHRHTHTQHTRLPHFSLWYLHRDFWQRLALRITAPEVESILSAAGCMGELCWYLAATSGFCEQDRRQTVSMLTDSAVSKLWGTVMNVFTFMPVLSFRWCWWFNFEIFYKINYHFEKCIDDLLC